MGMVFQQGGDQQRSERTNLFSSDTGRDKWALRVHGAGWVQDTGRRARAAQSLPFGGRHLSVLAIIC